jgi:uncharacterized protein YbgA (DUF1722 family)/uncharacterized protein YbbK (DUF523 family)
VSAPAASARAPVDSPDAPPRIGISACLLGQEVRFDGGHKRDPFLTESFGRHVQWVPVCPEVELGLGVPRETVRLERHADGLHLVAPKSGVDHTRAMERFASRRVAALAALGLDGFVLKKDSPSCGMERVRVHARGASAPAREGRGLFAAALVEGLPLLPVEEEGRLHDPRLRESFVARVFAHRRLRRLFARRWTVGDLVAFHASHKLELLAHSPEAYRTLGRLVAGAKGRRRAALRDEYERRFMAALARPATVGRQANVLQHCLGYFKRALDPASRAELASVIDDYRHGLVPLVVPVTLIRHHARRLGEPYLETQVWLAPHPKELMLRNHV